ncbi:hypothetical protein DPMN_141935 [Dreissena polymorpha]|uniref:Uncharacterized protein n=1 Tax=Dreissena polymorpha TaxID=45954 RepID=A0A9D4GAD4_DREPO|nr:hypothetical protein DPMN_141935 [Dreissena polymorpha]
MIILGNIRSYRIWYFTAQNERANRARKVLRETTYTICTPFFISVKAQSHYVASGAQVRDPCSTGMNRGSIGDDRGKPGLHRESIKMFNISGMSQESP